MRRVVDSTPTCEDASPSTSFWQLIAAPFNWLGLRRRRRTLYWLAGAATAVALMGCSKSPKEGAPKAEDPLALNKPAEEAPKPLLAPPGPAPAPTQTKPSKERDEIMSDDAPPSADDDEEEGDEAKDAPPKKDKKAHKKARNKTKKVKGRKRSSSVEAEETSTHSGDKDTASDDKDKSAEDATIGHVKLKRIQFSHRIEGREPVDPEETFSAAETDQLYAFLELTNDSKQKGKVVVFFVPPQGTRTKVTLDVGDKSRWRTWALRKSPKAIGTWKVIVQDMSGKEIGHRTFEVTE